MEYRINVARLEVNGGRMRYVYLFCTKITGIFEAKRVYNEIKSKFTEPEYEVSLEVWEHSGREVNAEEYFNKEGWKND